MDFEERFRTATGSLPYPYQRALAAGAELPDLLAVPTGTGKTAAAVLGWLWRRRFAPAPVRENTPRRLVYCLPMRSLVEQTETVARAWLTKLGLAQDISVHKLLGGAVDQAWEADPDRDLILVGTQDQLLSRALNRGYAMSRYRWPVHFAFLNNDALWVFDEVQLMGVGLSTAAQLEGLRRRLGTAVACRSIWMSATLSDSKLATVDLREERLTRLVLDDKDARDPRLAERLNASKPVAPAATAAQKKGGHVKAFAREIVAEHLDGTLTLVVVNQVARAQDLFTEIRRLSAAAGTRCLLVHGRFRPHDRAPRVTEVLSGGFRGILVATQAIEAGVDISARRLFTEVASWSSMVQRFGRCNRDGKCADAAIRWLNLPDDELAPYDLADVALARERLTTIADAGPAYLDRLAQDPPADPALPVIRRRDLLELFDTETDLSGQDLDISPYVRDSDERDVQVFWRELDAGPPPADTRVPRRDELCTAPIGGIDKLLKTGAKAYRWVAADREWREARRPIPGMMLLLARSQGGYDADLGWTGDPGHQPAVLPGGADASDDDDAEPLSLGCDTYVTLTQHSDDVASQMNGLARGLGLVEGTPWTELERAARWHDLGKVHPVFQEMLLSPVATDDALRDGGPWAKSDGRPGGHRSRRRFFRHELASALAFLAQGATDLEAYVVAAHHGKVRMAIRARPKERPPEAGQPDALGVWGWDVLPAAALGAGIVTVETTLSLAELALGAESWTRRTQRLLDTHGPFRLAYWESLVRVADWRGTKMRSEDKKREAIHD